MMLLRNVQGLSLIHIWSTESNKQIYVAVYKDSPRRFANLKIISFLGLKMEDWQYYRSPIPILDKDKEWMEEEAVSYTHLDVYKRQYLLTNPNWTFHH